MTQHRHLRNKCEIFPEQTLSASRTKRHHHCEELYSRNLRQNHHRFHRDIIFTETHYSNVIKRYNTHTVQLVQAH